MSYSAGSLKRGAWNKCAMGRAMVAERTYTHYAQDPTVMTFRAPSVLTIAERICFKRQVRDYDTDDLVSKPNAHSL